MGCPVPSREEQQVQTGVHVLSNQLLLVVVLIVEWFPTLCNPFDCRPLDSSVHGISQERILEKKKKENTENWFPFSSPGNLPDPGIEPLSPALVDKFFTREAHPFSTSS